jgi:HK97 family phage prohead protease
MATPNHLTKFKEQAQARALTLTPALDKSTEPRLTSERYVEGYAAKYDTYLLYDDGEYGKTYERFDPGCFDDCDMSDIIMQFDHRGRVFARGTNGTLLVEPDDVGLFIAADLDKTDLARGLYDDIKAEMITKMSWRFRPGTWHIERTEGSKDITIVHTKIKKVYDVSAVSIPANDDTELNARAWVDGVIAQDARREAELDERRRKLRIKIMTNYTGGKEV